MDLVTVLGLMAAFCTTVSFLPQAIKTIRTKQVDDLSLVMYSILTTGVLLWFVYGVLTNDLPVMLANGITSILTVVILYLMLRYK